MLGAYSVSPERDVVEPSRLGLEAYCMFRLDRPGWLDFETGGANEMRRVIMFKACCDFSGFDDLTLTIQKVWLSGLDDVIASCFFLSPCLENHPRLQWPDLGIVTWLYHLCLLHWSSFEWLGQCDVI